MPVRINTTLHKKAIGQINQLYDLVNDLGVDFWGVCTIFKWGRANYHIELFPLPEELISNMAAFLNSKKYRNGKIDVVGYIPTILGGKISGSTAFCEVYKRHLTIELGKMGNAIVMASPLHNEPRSELKSSYDIEDIWMSDTFRRYKTSIGGKNKKICSSCAFKNTCII